MGHDGNRAAAVSTIGARVASAPLGAAYGAMALGLGFVVLGIVVAGLGYALLGLITPAVAQRYGLKACRQARRRVTNQLQNSRRLGP